MNDVQKWKLRRLAQAWYDCQSFTIKSNASYGALINFIPSMIKDGLMLNRFSMKLANDIWRLVRPR